MWASRFFALFWCMLCGFAEYGNPLQNLRHVGGRDLCQGVCSAFWPSPRIIIISILLLVVVVVIIIIIINRSLLGTLVLLRK